MGCGAVVGRVGEWWQWDGGAVMRGAAIPAARCLAVQQPDPYYCDAAASSRGGVSRAARGQLLASRLQ